MNAIRLIDANALKKSLNFVYACSYIESKSKEGIASDIIEKIDIAPTVKAFTVDEVEEIRQATMEQVRINCKQNERPQAENNSENALLMDIAHSLAIIADNSAKEGNTQETGNETLHWVHSEAHRVMCPKCGCRVSINAAYEMNYCFKCGAKLGGIKNDNS